MRLRHEATVTSISWIPSEAMQGMMRLPMDMGIGHYDDPLPESLSGYEELMALRDADRFRFANVLKAWIEVDEDGRIVDLGYDGGGVIGVTTARLGGKSITFEAIPFGDLRAEPQITGGTARFVQTCGGRTGAPLPRRVRRPPYIRLQAPTAWSTMALEIDADGTSRFEVLGASPFPRHWIYGPDWKLAAKSGLIDMKAWTVDGAQPTTPWGDEDSPALVTAVESALERQLSLSIMRDGAKPRIRKLAEGDLLTEQDTVGEELYLLLDGVLRVEVDGEAIAEVGPGAIVGERAILEGGTRTSTLRAVTPCRVAAANAQEVDRDALVALSQGHRREEQLAP